VAERAPSKTLRALWWSTQEVSQPEELEEVLIAQLNIKVVGCQHYHGTAHEGEYVNLIREPRNPYDRNAIRVDNLAGVQVGHVPRDFAVGLAPIFDGAEQKGLSVEAAITNKGNKWNLPMQLTIYGPPEGEAQAFVERHFRECVTASSQRPG
jgi:SWI/SNF-related matrix-associated actin-dependent regulator of chromatin subfamily A3